MAIHKLSPSKVATAKAGKYEDGGCLRLYVSKAGGKWWVLRYTIKNKRREMGLGMYPDIGLANARDKAAAFRAKIKAGIDPIEEKKAEKFIIPTFTTCAARYIRAHRKGWKNAKHARQWVSTLKTYVRPVIGEKVVDAIGTEDILKILSPIWSTKTETAKRVQTRVENVLDYAAAHKYRDQPNPARWRGHLDKLLAKPSRVTKVNHHPAMPHQDVATFMFELAQNDSLSARALSLLVLTATRTNEVLKAKWSEFDLTTGVWIIPAERTKAKREHRVPLTEASISILSTLPRLNEYVFPGTRHNRPLSDMSLLQLMRGMGFGVGGKLGNYVPHGFRSSFRDWASEVSHFPSDMAEMALGHVIESKVEAAYRRGDLFNKRREMMKAWAIYIREPMANASVIPFIRAS